jgi:hypothetical protein
MSSAGGEGAAALGDDLVGVGAVAPAADLGARAMLEVLVDAEEVGDLVERGQSERPMAIMSTRPSSATRAITPRTMSTRAADNVVLAAARFRSRNPACSSSRPPGNPE